jgi:hypothetical protein
VTLELYQQYPLPMLAATADEGNLIALTILFLNALMHPCLSYEVCIDTELFVKASHAHHLRPQKPRLSQYG